MNNRYKTQYDKYEGADGVVYVNVAISNTDTTLSGTQGATGSSNQPNGLSTLMQTTEVRSDSIVKNANDYFIAINRFSIPLYDTPFINFANYINKNQSDVNLSNLSFTLSVSSVDVQKFVEFVPSLPGFPLPSFPGQQSNYYYMYDVVNFLSMCNTALSSALTTLQSEVGGGITAAHAPFFIYDPPSQLISLIVEEQFYNSGNTGHIEIYHNSLLTPFFYSIVSTQVKLIDNSGFGKQILFTVRNQNNNFFDQYAATPSPPYLNSGPVNPGYNYIQLQQEAISFSYWNAFKSIVVQTGSMPLVPEAIPLFSDVNNVSSNLNTAIILSDFVPDLLNNAGTHSQIAIYNPGFAEMRLINMMDMPEIRIINLIIKWVDNFGFVHDYSLPPGTQATLKIAFIPKSFYITKH